MDDTSGSKPMKSSKSKILTTDNSIPKKKTKVKSSSGALEPSVNTLFHSKKQWKKKREAYSKYLTSGKWKNKRKKILRRCRAEAGSPRGFCERCSKKRRLEVHHLTYDRVFRERLDDLMGLCIPCHRIMDEERRFKKRMENVS